MSDAKYRLDDFEFYNAARAFRKKTYSVARLLPAQEGYVLNPQMRRAALSVSNNIAEGHGRWHYQENIRFCRISRGSIGEVIDDLNVCTDEGYVELELIDDLRSDAYLLIRRVNSYIQYLRTSQQGRTDLG